MTAVSRKPPEIKTWVELDLGDAELKVEEFADGIFAVWIDDARVLLDQDQMRQFVSALGAIHVAKEWNT